MLLWYIGVCFLMFTGCQKIANTQEEDTDASVTIDNNQSDVPNQTWSPPQNVKIPSTVSGSKSTSSSGSSQSSSLGESKVNSQSGKSCPATSASPGSEEWCRDMGNEACQSRVSDEEWLQKCESKIYAK